jgi:hypothetical protein
VEDRKRPPRTQKRRVNAKTPRNALVEIDSSLPNIAELIDYGEITIGNLRPVGCVATAVDEDCTYAMLVRRHGETLGQLLTRLDQAIHKAFTEQIFTDEINPPPTRP